VLARPSALERTPSREVLAAVVPAEWVSGTTEQTLTVQAFVNVGGRGRLVACADLPIRAARAVTTLPRAGGSVPLGWSVVAGAILLVAGALVRGQQGR
jgi:hypothetical protein